MVIIQEHSAKIDVVIPKGDVHAGMDIFYNPLMVSNRNISILLLNCVKNKKMNIVDPLAGSGIRSLRFLQELDKKKMNHLFVNDKKENFRKVFQQHLLLNKIPVKFQKRCTIGNEEASFFLLNRINDHVKPEDFCGYADYIDIDPFGSPNPFLSAAIARIARNGIIAITATDTAALTGTYPAVTQRKYWAKSLKNYLMHELGLRILIRKVQLQAMQFDKAFFPLLAYHKDHYFRLFFTTEKSKKKCDGLVQKHQYFLWCSSCLNQKISSHNQELCSCGQKFTFAGPLWVGDMANLTLLEKMIQQNPFPEEESFLKLLAEENKIPQVGFYDLHALAALLKINPPKIISVLKEFTAVRTHFSPNGIKTKHSLDEIKEYIQTKAIVL